MPRRAIFIGSLPPLPLGVRAVRRINAAGWQAVVVTDQPGYDERLRSELLDEGARLDGIYHCAHPPEAHCSCRKPGTALLERARDKVSQWPSIWEFGNGDE